MKKTAFLNLVTGGTHSGGLIRKIALFAIPFVLVLAGFGLGSVTGDYLITGLLTGNRRLGLLLYRPSFQHFETVSLLNSDNEYKRIEGYYALQDSDKIDVAYLAERYGAETSAHTKRIILWVMGFSRNKREAMSALSSMYHDAPESLKQDILSAMKRIDKRSYREFIEKNNIKQNIRNAL